MTNMINSIGIELVLLKAGSFNMGSPVTEKDRDADEGPQHPVVLTHDFYISECLITQEQFETILGWNYSKFKNAANPIEMISKTEADMFCKKLSELEGRPYSLPSEAQWEYACRAGNDAPYCFTGNFDEIERYAWYRDNSMNMAHPVGEKKPNAWGLYDMHGNVWEWCLDKWQEAGYRPENKLDPVCNEGDTFVIRGGSYLNQPQALRSAKRFGYNNQRNSCVGFRVVLNGA